MEGSNADVHGNLLHLASLVLVCAQGSKTGLDRLQCDQQVAEEIIYSYTTGLLIHLPTTWRSLRPFRLED